MPVGNPDGVPLTTDFDGDGKADPATYAPGTAIWAWLESALQTPKLQQFGMAGNDRAMPSPVEHRRTSGVVPTTPRAGRWPSPRPRRSSRSRLPQQVANATSVPGGWNFAAQARTLAAGRAGLVRASWNDRLRKPLD